ncbi:uncharacterized protein BO97DRAFT_100623 [Aspergillus homomorphus CBS 101889]|uniref:Secreted protein n=1 Tax=Aspergillus homomorphus (strain CBS 101889) TaxID=1450537 RepID=A0A395HWT3_ASPHC|nr:hypothetical protein BO97DRAFT_100623 [Aspergillus homomorphus CBS 101889]RAL11308.1 hypothetical protein BO97DRAFT_100623 [Aspergillus homomorphus CBS 101889]
MRSSRLSFLLVFATSFQLLTVPVTIPQSSGSHLTWYGPVVCMCAVSILPTYSNGCLKSIQTHTTQTHHSPIYWQRSRPRGSLPLLLPSSTTPTGSVTRHDPGHLNNTNISRCVSPPRIILVQSPLPLSLKPIVPINNQRPLASTTFF